MTTMRISIPAIRVAQLRPINARWTSAFAFTALLGLIGGEALVKQVVVMVAQVLFLAFTIGFLITAFVASLAMVRHATRSAEPVAAGPHR